MAAGESPDLGAVRMERTAVDELLRDRGFGVLALADRGAAYPVPMSFGYDGDRAYMAFLRTGAESRKHQFGRSTERAALLVYEVESAHEWASAVVSGPLTPLPDAEWDAAADALDANGWHPSAFTAAAPTQGIDWWVLDVEEATGRRSQGGGSVGVAGED